MPIYEYDLDRMGRTYFEFYKTIAPSTECRTWEQLSDYARQSWIRVAMRSVARNGR